jgi:hypothetical protein
LNIDFDDISRFGGNVYGDPSSLHDVWSELMLWRFAEAFCYESTSTEPCMRNVI